MFLIQRISALHRFEATSASGGVAVAVDGERRALFADLNAAISEVSELTECGPGDHFESADPEALVPLLRVDRTLREYPGDDFAITVNGESIDLSSEDCGLPSETVIAMDDGDVASEALFRAGPWVYLSRADEEPYSWRFEEPFNGRQLALDYLESNSFRESGGEFSELIIESTFLNSNDGSLLVATFVGLTSSMLLNGEPVTFEPDE